MNIRGPGWGRMDLEGRNTGLLENGVFRERACARERNKRDWGWGRVLGGMVDREGHGGKDGDTDTLRMPWKRPLKGQKRQARVGGRREDDRSDGGEIQRGLTRGMRNRAAMEGQGRVVLHEDGGGTGGVTG